MLAFSILFPVCLPVVRWPCPRFWRRGNTTMSPWEPPLKTTTGRHNGETQWQPLRKKICKLDMKRKIESTWNVIWIILNYEKLIYFQYISMVFLFFDVGFKNCVKLPEGNCCVSKQQRWCFSCLKRSKWVLHGFAIFFWGLPHNWGAPFMCKPGTEKRNASMMLVCIFRVKERMKSTSAAAVEFSGYQLQNWLKYVVKTGKQNEAKIVWKHRIVT